MIVDTERLRRIARGHVGPGVDIRRDILEAADEIDRLRVALDMAQELHVSRVTGTVIRRVGPAQWVVMHPKALSDAAGYELDVNGNWTYQPGPETKAVFTLGEAPAKAREVHERTLAFMNERNAAKEG